MSSGSMEVVLSIRFVLYFRHVALVFCRDLPTFVLERKIVIFSKDNIDSE